MGKFVDNSFVTIKPMAYFKMLSHVLRFGSKSQNPRQFKEVIGMLIGHLEGEGDIKNVTVEDSIPISHGGSIEVKFSEEQLGAFGEIDMQIFEKYGSKNWFTVGWYHSHPGLQIFFSSTDVFNQLFWQDKNPSGIGIVFDHVYLETPNDMGFRTFRLDDPSKGLNSKYHEVKTLVEPPDSLDFYMNIIELINKIHSKEPPILELNEITELFGDLFIPDQEKLITKKPELDYTEVISALKDSMSSFLELSIEPFIKILNAWSQEVVNKTFYNNTQMRKDLVELKDNLSSGITKLQKSFNYSLQEKLKELDFYIDDRLDSFDEENENLKQIIEEFNEKLMKLMQDLFKQKFKPLLEQIVINFDKSLVKMNDISKKSEIMAQNFEINSQTLDNLSKILEPSKIRIRGGIESNNEKIFENFKKKLKTIEVNFTNLDKDSKNLLSDLKAAILVLEGSKDPILNKISKMEQEKKELLNKIKQLKKGE